MANQSKLKAWVRYDGTGRVISGGPIFQVNKPKVGNWKQIDADLCCNGGLTTTTTTTSGGVTPTAFVKNYWLTGYDSCNNTTQGTGIFYSSSSTFEAGIAVFTDAALTIPATQGWVIYPGGMSNSLLVGSNGVLSIRSCPMASLIQGTYLVASLASTACQGMGVSMSINVPDTGIATAAYVTADFASYSILPGSSIFILYNIGGTNYTRQFTVSFTSPTIANAQNASQTC